MRRYLGYAVAWTAVTTLAVVVSWLAVRGAVQYAVVGDAPVPRVETHAMSKMAYAKPGGGDQHTEPDRPRDTGLDEEAYEDDRREVVHTTHGDVLVEQDPNRPSGVRLLAATPEEGYRQSVWETPAWIRVDFTNRQHGSAVFVTWHGDQPQVDTYDY